MSKTTNSNVGAAHELLVCADLIRRGFDVYRSVTPNAACDIVAIRSGRMFRVEVTTATITGAGWSHAKGGIMESGRFDVLALVTHDGRMSYQEHGRSGRALFEPGVTVAEERQRHEDAVLK